MDDRIEQGIRGTGMTWERMHWLAHAKLREPYEIAAVCDKMADKELDDMELVYTILRTIKENRVLSL